MQHSIVAQPAEVQDLRHDPITIALHWITAVLVGVLWVIGQTVEKVEQLLTSAGVSLVYAGYPYDPFVPR